VAVPVGTMAADENGKILADLTEDASRPLSLRVAAAALATPTCQLYPPSAKVRRKGRTAADSEPILGTQCQLAGRFGCPFRRTLALGG